MKVLIAWDHYTIDLVEKIEKYLSKKSYIFENIWSKDKDSKLLLQEIIPNVSEWVRNWSYDFWILICWTWAWVEIWANRFKNIRVSLCIKPDQAKFARIYDNANVLCLSSWLIDNPEEILDSWFNNTFDENEKRLKMIEVFDSWD